MTGDPVRQSDMINGINFSDRSNSPGPTGPTDSLVMAPNGRLYVSFSDDGQPTIRAASTVVYVNATAWRPRYRGWERG